MSKTESSPATPNGRQVKPHRSSQQNNHNACAESELPPMPSELLLLASDKLMGPAIVKWGRDIQAMILKNAAPLGAESGGSPSNSTGQATRLNDERPEDAALPVASETAANTLRSAVAGVASETEFRAVEILRMLVEAASADKLEDFSRTSNVADMAADYLKNAAPQAETVRPDVPAAAAVAAPVASAEQVRSETPMVDRVAFKVTAKAAWPEQRDETIEVVKVEDARRIEHYLIEEVKTNVHRVARSSEQRLPPLAKASAGQLERELAEAREISQKYEDRYFSERSAHEALARRWNDAEAAAAHFVRDDPRITPRRAMERQAVEIERLKLAASSEQRLSPLANVERSPAEIGKAIAAKLAEGETPRVDKAVRDPRWPDILIREAIKLERELAAANTAFNNIAKEGLKRADEADELRSARPNPDLLDDRFTGAFIEHFIENYDVGHEGNIQLLLDFGVALVGDLLGEPFTEFMSKVTAEARANPRSDRTEPHG